MRTATARRFLQWSAAMVADLAAALENESGVTNEKVASLQSAAAGAAHAAALHRLPALVAQVLQKIFDERLHNSNYQLTFFPFPNKFSAGVNEATNVRLSSIANTDKSRSIFKVRCDKKLRLNLPITIFVNEACFAIFLNLGNGQSAGKMTSMIKLMGNFQFAFTINKTKLPIVPNGCKPFGKLEVSATEMRPNFEYADTVYETKARR